MYANKLPHDSMAVRRFTPSLALVAQLTSSRISGPHISHVRLLTAFTSIQDVRNCTAQYSKMYHRHQHCRDIVDHSGREVRR